jgi:hypothetical protein
MEVFKEFDLSDAFLSTYLYELEFDLNESNQLSQIKFQSEESNTDEYLKYFFKEYISKRKKLKNQLLSEVKFYYFNHETIFDYKDILECEIIDVLTPTELTNEIKQTFNEEKNGVYTNPDLLLIIKEKNKFVYKSIELKSTKNNLIPGSSVQQVSPFEWVIFVKRGGKSITITTGLYIESIDNKLPFPDRSPRPIIGFNNLENHNKVNRVLTDNTLCVSSNHELMRDKLRLISDWRDHLIKEWMETVLIKKKISNEKWFNYVVRKFSVELIEKVDQMTPTDKNNLLLKLRRDVEESL